MTTKRLCYLFLIGCFFFAACNESEHYDIPEGEYGTVVQVMEARGNFTHFLSGMDKLDEYDGFTENEGIRYRLASSSYTLFPPNDEAFELYFKERGIGGLAELQEEELRGIIEGHITRNALTWDKLLKVHMSNWSDEDEKGPHSAGLWGFKRPTVYSAPTVVETSLKDGRNYRVWQSYKFLPVMTEHFYCGLSTPEDYPFLYQDGSNYSSQNIHRARIVNPDIPASNGILHELDRVVPPLKNIDLLMADMPDKFSLFRSLCDRFAEYGFSLAGTERQPLNNLGYRDSVYVKYYPKLEGSCNQANTSIAQDLVSNRTGTNLHQGENTALSTYIPTNDVLQTYLDQTFLNGRYESMDDVPLEALAYLVGNHMAFLEVTWARPSDLSNGLTGLNEPMSLDKDRDVVMATFANNGVFYGINKVLEPNIYKSVASSIIFDPEYGLLLKMFVENAQVKQLLSNSDSELTFFPVSDQGLNFEYGLEYDELREVLTKLDGNGQVELASTSFINDLINSHLVDGEALADVQGRRFLETVKGEFVCVENGTVYGGGNFEQNTSIEVLESDAEGNNGVAHKLSAPILPATLTANDYVKGKPKSSVPEDGLVAYNAFRDLFNKAEISVPSGEITLLVPTNDAINEALLAGKIPGLATDGSVEDEAKFKNFLYLHIITEERIYSDGQKSGKFVTKAKDSKGNFVPLDITNAQRDIRIVGVGGESVEVKMIPGSSSDIIAKSAAIHLIDDVLLPEN
ncbi:hypothetical protein FUAX_28780 [Fulvitalea axinellae]|uniref:FAS1 domain-containing protein n=1 Tax=Fulvitalea axinellae TaxID=1182444 RepID=A0AAU9CE93_9BACT|nr:hypothetical protein FUAX_28780 [Fulvitalea axinellae]